MGVRTFSHEERVEIAAGSSSDRACATSLWVSRALSNRNIRSSRRRRASEAVAVDEIVAAFILPPALNSRMVLDLTAFTRGSQVWPCPQPMRGRQSISATSPATAKLLKSASTTRNMPASGIFPRIRGSSSSRCPGRLDSWFSYADGSLRASCSRVTRLYFRNLSCSRVSCATLRAPQFVTHLSLW